MKNYKELCHLLEIEPKTSNSKKAQLKELQRFIKYEKDGNKFVVLEIYDEPLEIIDGRLFSKKTAPYIDDLELLLLDFLLYCEGDMTISKSGLYTALKMVNTNYTKYNGNLRPALANDLNISIDMINEFYDNASSILSNSIQTVLNRLSRKKLIHVQEVKMIAYVESIPIETNEFGEIKHNQIIHIDNDIERIEYVPSSLKSVVNRKIANDEEIKRILYIEREVLKEFGFKEETKSNYLVASGLYHKFKKEVNKRTLERLNIAYNYKAYKILFNHDHVKEERQYILERTLKLMKQGKVNDGIKKHITTNSKRHSINLNDKYWLELGMDIENLSSIDNIPAKHKVRLHKDFMDNVRTLNRQLIHINIKQEEE